jgi:hypothetical protein
MESSDVTFGEQGSWPVPAWLLAPPACTKMDPSRDRAMLAHGLSSWSNTKKLDNFHPSELPAVWWHMTWFGRPES